jgi:prephenate dehydrogenase
LIDHRGTIGIIGFGRFGRYWANFLNSDHRVLVTDKAYLAEDAEKMGLEFRTLPALCAESDTIFLCVPINQIESAVSQLKPHIKPGTLLFDTCSVKMYPARVMLSEFEATGHIDLIASHPLFGPDSGALGVRGLPIVMWPLRVSDSRYREWHAYFEQQGMQVVEMSPEKHDRMAANSQGVTHYIGRVIGELDLQETPIDTKGFKILLSLVEQICNDSGELFQDLQNYNPYTKDMRLGLEEALRHVYGQLLPSPKIPGRMVVGIQGGKGSFNEEACRHYCESRQIADFDIKYLYTAPNVLDSLHKGDIDRGIFAIQSAKGGVVMESLHALGRYNCEIEHRFEILVDHCILHHPDVDFEDVGTLISHPQALAQCKGNLTRKYPNLEQISGERDLIDQALCARHIAEGKLPITMAVLAPKVCAELFDLTIHETSLQDRGKRNLTTFLWVKRGVLYQ